jgi:hypothetical protein
VNLKTSSMSWNALTERQKQLDRAIDTAGVRLDSSDRCLRQIMRTIGASASEESYVRERIALRLRTEALLGETDKFISDTEVMLDRFAKDDEEWRRRGRALGFDF